MFNKRLYSVGIVLALTLAVVPSAWASAAMGSSAERAEELPTLSGESDLEKVDAPSDKTSEKPKRVGPSETFLEGRGLREWVR